jgi:uncharacterized protein YgbK (DUF1537 family)
MLKILVIADDLSGANDTGAILNDSGFDAVTAPLHSVLDEDGSPDAFWQRRDALCVSTHCRSLAEEACYERVTSAIQQFKDQNILFSIRAGSPFYSHIGTSIRAALDLLPDHKAVVVLAAPQSGCTCVGGYILMNGTPLSESLSANFLKPSGHPSLVMDILGHQARCPMDYIPLSDVLAGESKLLEDIQNSSNRVIVVDAVTEKHIHAIARACHKSGMKFFCVDPGLFTKNAAQYLFKEPQHGNMSEPHKNGLLLVGSRTTMSLRQLEYLANKDLSVNFSIDIDRLIDQPPDEYARALSSYKLHKSHYPMFCMTTLYSQMEETAESTENYIARSEKIAYNMSEMAQTILRAEGGSIDFVYLSGGDITRAFVLSAGAKGLDLLHEPIPMAVYAKIIGGPFDGLPICAKGGSAGGDSALQLIYDKIRAYTEQTV